MRALRVLLVLAAAAPAAGCGMKLNEPLDPHMTDNPAWQQHVKECSEKHPGYNPMTNTYIDTRGRTRLC